MYGKLFRSLWDGSLRGLPHPQLVFAYMIAHAGRTGVVDVIRKKIADDTGLSRAEVDAAIEYLASPDPESRQTTEEGRRILPLDESRSWGWQVVNYEYYRGLKNEEERREQNREAQARRRQKLAGDDPVAPSAEVSARQHPSAPSAHADAEAEAQTDLPGLATQGVPLTRAAVFDAAGATGGESLLVDAYLGLEPTNDEEWANVSRQTLLGDSSWRTMVSEVGTKTTVGELQAAAVRGDAEGNKRDVLQLVNEIAAAKSLSRKDEAVKPAPAPGAPKPPRVHVGKVYDLCKHLGKERSSTCLAVVQRIFNAGIRTEAVYMGVAKWYVDHVENIRNPWAYFSPGGEGFEALRSRLSAEASVEEHKALNEADARWLTPATAAEQAAR